MSDFPEITCQDHKDPTLDAVDVEYIQGAAVQWVARATDNANNIVGSGTVSVGQEYTITSSDPNMVLPAFITMTFYDQDNNILQSTTFPSGYCLGYQNTIDYRSAYSQIHIVEVQDLISGIISTRDTVKEALWVRLTVDASESPVPVKLQTLELLTNMYDEPINLTDAVDGVELNGNGESATVTREGNTRSSRGRTSIDSLNHSRQELNGDTKTMTVMVGPMTIDTYWRNGYTFFATVVAEQSNNNSVGCNGFDFQEHIFGLQ
jgi:hypothetical protein